MSWNNSRELLAAINATVSDLDNPIGDIKVALRKAAIQVQAFRAAAQVYRVELDHAVRTQRLITGSPVLPAVKFDEAAAPVLVQVAPEAKRRG